MPSARDEWQMGRMKRKTIRAEPVKTGQKTLTLTSESLFSESTDRKDKLVRSIGSFLRKGRSGVSENWYLVKIEKDHAITKKTDARFLMEYQRSILLELKERGALTEMQYRNAVEAIERQLRSVMQEPGLNSSCESDMK